MADKETKMTEDLYNAAEEGDVEALKAALAAVADVDVTSEHGDTALIAAARSGAAECVKLLIAAGADVNVIDEELGWTPLIYAGNEGNLEVTHELLAAGADPCLGFEDDSHALAWCAGVGLTQCVRNLIAAGANVNLEDDCAIINAAEEGHEECLKLLIDAGADVNQVDEYGKTPLSIAASKGFVSCVEILKAAGAEGDYDIQQEEEEEEEEDDDEFDEFDEKDDEESCPVWEGTISQMWEYKMYFPGKLSELLNVGKNDRLMYVHVCANETSNEWSQVDEYIVIYLKREGGEWMSVCWPRVPHDDANPHFPENWNWEEMLDSVWEGNTVNYTTKLNENYDQVEATWEVEE